MNTPKFTVKMAKMSSVQQETQHIDIFDRHAQETAVKKKKRLYSIHALQQDTV